MITLPEFDLYLFDLDDTLINTRAAYTAAQQTAVSCVLPHIEGEPLQQLLKELYWLCRLFGSGQPNNYFTAFVRMLPIEPAKRDETVAHLLSAYREAFHNHLKAFDGVVSYLKSLRDNKKTLGIVSNGKTDTQRQKLSLTRLADYFLPENCFVSEMFSPEEKKPAPHMLQTACRRTGIAPEQTVFFGNIPADILAGNLAGTTTILYGNAFQETTGIPRIAHPDFQITDWRNGVRS